MELRADCCADVFVTIFAHYVGIVSSGFFGAFSGVIRR